ncbi:MAG: hypothetical protein SXA11_01190 [Cyanobacteriota bacterium]|nr:hypothetical protein [Cyanobacteriota bacterium]
MARVNSPWKFRGTIDGITIDKNNRPQGLWPPQNHRRKEPSKTTANSKPPPKPAKPSEKPSQP